MKVSPLDLRQARFNTTMRGFDRVEVTAFLMAVAEDYEHAVREMDRLQQDVVRMEAALNEHREQERSLKNALLAAQRLADDMKARAEEEARQVLVDAQGKADAVVNGAQGRLQEVQREIDILRQKRKDVETSISGTIQTLRNALEIVREQESPDRDDKVLLHRPRQAGGAAPDTSSPQLPVAQGASS
jgi:cell division initiation protein